MEPSVANLRARLSSEGLSNQKERPTDEEIDHRSLWVNPRNIVILGPLTSRLPKKLSGLSLTVPWVLQDPAKSYKILRLRKSESGEWLDRFQR